MADPLTLIGFRHSVYTCIVRMALIEMGLKADYIEADPFADTPDPVLAAHTPFGRVPVLRHGAFILTETSAILRYLDALSAHPSLIPVEPKAAGRMAQVIGIVDAYGYMPLVRQVFSHGYYRPAMGEPFDPAEVARGLVQAEPTLSALDSIAAEGLQLTGDAISLADLHLAPMIAYFAIVAEGDASLRRYSALAAWWDRSKARASLVATDPFAKP